MKALLRHKGETVHETDGITGIDWNTGAPLTNPDWYGGPYILVNNYVPSVEDDFAEDSEPISATAEMQDTDAPVPVGGTIVIDGVTYTRAS